MDKDRSGSIRLMGLACIIAALLTGVLEGIWEIAYPTLTSEESFAAASPVTRWRNALSAALKSAGFLAGLFGLFRIATRQGWVLKIFMGLAAAGGLFFSAVWAVIAVTGKLTLVYVLGGMWYQMIAPVALGVAALVARRVPWWVGAYSIVVGLLNSQIFMLFEPNTALIVQGILWAVLGYFVYAYADAPESVPA